MSQAEHDSVAQSVLITDDADFAEAAAEAVARRLKDLPRGNIAGASWEGHGAILVVETLGQAARLANQIAPEHLELAVAEPEALLPEIRNAGAIFLGRHTPEAVGDYLAGPNHVLPTSRSARFASGLSVLDFMKRSSLVGCPASALETIGPAVATLADSEGLDAHALSVRVRLNGQAAG